MTLYQILETVKPDKMVALMGCGVDFEKQAYQIIWHNNDLLNKVVYSISSTHIDSINMLVICIKEDENILPTKNMMVAVYDSKKMHIYDVKTSGKHPVHMIEGGQYLTEDETIINQQGEMGWFWLNEKDYNYFKSLVKEVTFNIKDKTK